MSARTVFDALQAMGWTMATAESCTGGMVAAAITDIAGSSEVFDRGFVTYSNAAKTEMLSVSAALVKAVGAVSEQVARAMAEGALTHSRADIAVSITGIAGPSGGSAEKPVGLVHFGCAVRNGNTFHAIENFGALSRSEIRSLATERALDLVAFVLKQEIIKQ